MTTLQRVARRIVPAPLLSLSLWAVWLLLNRSLGAGHLLLGAVLALLIPVLAAGLRPRRVRVRSPGAVLRLMATVFVDASRSNVAVVRRLLQSRQRAVPSGFVHVPLDLRDPNALAVLAAIVCMTPGTAWGELSLDRSVLLLHVLELHDPADVIHTVKTRYERPLMEIFES